MQMDDDVLAQVPRLPLSLLTPAWGSLESWGAKEMTGK